MDIPDTAVALLALPGEHAALGRQAAEEIESLRAQVNGPGGSCQLCRHAKRRASRPLCRVCARNLGHGDHWESAGEPAAPSQTRRTTAPGDPWTAKIHVGLLGEPADAASLAQCWQPRPHKRGWPLVRLTVPIRLSKHVRVRECALSHREAEALIAGLSAAMAANAEAARKEERRQITGERR